MPRLVEATMKATPYIKNVSLDDLISTNAEALRIAGDWLKANS